MRPRRGSCWHVHFPLPYRIDGGVCGNPMHRAVALVFVMLLSPLPVAAVCGDTVLDAGEQCDDGGMVDGDCCSATCQFEGNGADCASDSNPCTQDRCNGAGACVHPPRDVESAVGCFSPDLFTVPTSGQLVLRDLPNDDADRLTWRWRQVDDAELLMDFGDPTTTDTYTLCVADDMSFDIGLGYVGGSVRARLTIPPGGTCANR